MAKLKLTRPELKRQRDALQRFERYLPMLKLKQQQLQLTIREVHIACRAAEKRMREAEAVFEPYQTILADVAGVDVKALAEPQEVKTSEDNIAGVTIPIFEGLEFPPADYSLFATPPWVDKALADLRAVTTCRIELDVLHEQEMLLQKELTKIVQRVNLFEKIKIPDAQEAIRIIRIHLGDEMTAGVGRAKIAKTKLAAKTHQSEQADKQRAVAVAAEPQGETGQ
ncbi:MAG: V-type ATP synthase subunit D [Planctomycetota bacterium]|jgi:V/A-type H+-transporting ATPase subunit D